jgi:hypothetical protein
MMQNTCSSATTELLEHSDLKPSTENMSKKLTEIFICQLIFRLES